MRNPFKKIFTFWRKQIIIRAAGLVNFCRTCLKPLFRKSLKDVQATKSYYSEEEFAYRFEMDSDVLSEALKSKVGRALKGSKTKAKDVIEFLLGRLVETNDLLYILKNRLYFFDMYFCSG